MTLVSPLTTFTLRDFGNDVYVDPFTQIFFADRAAYRSHQTTTIICRAGYSHHSSFVTPQVTWLKDGVPVTYTPTNTISNSRYLISTLSFQFLESDAGVYQCVFTDTPRFELLAIHPIQIDFGEQL